MKPPGFFQNGGMAMLLGFACLLTAMGFGIADDSGMRPVVILIVLGIIQLAGVQGVQMQRLERLLLSDSPEARQFRRRRRLADAAKESAAPAAADELKMERSSHQ